MKKLVFTQLLLSGALALTACSKSQSSGGDGGGGNTGVTPQGYVGGVGDTFDNSYGKPQITIKGQAIRNRSFYLNDRIGNQTQMQNDVILYFDNFGILNAVANIDVAIFEEPYGMNQFTGGMGYPGQYQQPYPPYQNPQIPPPQTNPSIQQQRLFGIVQFKATNIPYKFDPATREISIDSFNASSAVPSQSVSQSYGMVNPAQPQQPVSVQGRLGIRIGLEKDTNKNYRFVNYGYQRMLPSFKARLIDDSDQLIGGGSSGFDPNSAAFDVEMPTDKNVVFRLRVGDVFPQNMNYSSINYNSNMPQPQIQQNTLTIGRFTSNPFKKKVDYVSPILDQRGFIK